MRKLLYSGTVLLFARSLLWITADSCRNNTNEKSKKDSLAIKESLQPAAVLSPGESIKKMHIEDGFTVKLVAAEPLVVAPVALSFDDNGRIWAVEMVDYMPDTVGTGESEPIGKVVILSDKNGDGLMDHRQVFLDSLVLPRAICLIEDGILVAEPPKLWYYRIKGDKPIQKTLVDSTYADGGNVEHQPNGLYRALDNWIYSAKSARRYRKKGDRWLVERTHFRGQWGISGDDWGRLFYNTNSENLLGDYFPPGLGATNKNQQAVAGFVKKIVADNRVYPVRPTPGVNRGYMEGVLDDSLRLVNFTAACGPVIYSGDLFGRDYEGNAFVAEPSANLIKRNIVHEEGYTVTGREAYEHKEFLASEDERFRPVSLYNGPDGALYIVDMYRGIIQHKTYLTPYLKNEIKERALAKPLSCGRIYKVVPQNTASKSVTCSNEGVGLVSLLNHPNGWVRARAQQKLVDGRHTDMVPLLRANLKKGDQPLALTHSLWTLEGLGALQWVDVQPLLGSGNWHIRMQALTVLPAVLNKANYQQVLPVLQTMIAANDSMAAPYIAFLASFVRPLNGEATHALLVSLTKKYSSNLFVADAVVSNLQDREALFYKEAVSMNGDTSQVIIKRLKKVMDDMAAAKNNSNAKLLKKEFPKGVTIFESVCQTCHGPTGNGVSSLAPPLNGSDWVTGPKNRFIPIILYGLTGPVKVGGKLYKAPEINGDMPGIGQNTEFSDDDMAQVLSYIRNSWNNKGERITAEEVKKVRDKYAGRQKAFTAEELESIK